jgi:DNA-directed RNA polymerase II subunit RPB1
LSDATDEDLRRLSPWVLRIELNQTVFFDKKMKMNEIVREINNEYGNDLNVLVTDDNADELVVRVRIVNDAAANQVDEEGNPIGGTEEVEAGQEDDVFLKRLERSMLSQSQASWCGSLQEGLHARGSKAYYLGR